MSYAKEVKNHIQFKQACSSRAFFEVCAFQFWAKARKFPTKAWEDYLRLCKAGGSKSFLELMELAELKNPFKDGAIQGALQPIKKWLNAIEDDNLS